MTDKITDLLHSATERAIEHRAQQLALAIAIDLTSIKDKLRRVGFHHEVVKSSMAALDDSVLSLARGIAESEIRERIITRLLGADDDR